MLPLAFLDVAFAAGNLPSLDLSNVSYYHLLRPITADYFQICSSYGSSLFAGTALPDCSFLAPDIQECQAKGKIVTLSIGGASGDVGFTSDSQAKEFADTIWNLFLGGSSSMRPFGDATLDGYDKCLKLQFLSGLD